MRKHEPFGGGSPRARPKIAVIGTRGIPASWGGVERQCEELYTRMAHKFDIVIFARKYYIPDGIKNYRGVEIVSLPTIKSKHFDAAVHTIITSLFIGFRSFDIVHYYSQGPCLFSFITRILNPRSKVFFTCGGLDWQRRKWSPVASIIIRLGEWCSAHCTHERIMVSRGLVAYYRARHRVESACIPNGVNLPASHGAESLAPLGLAPGGYVVFVGRLVPEKRVQDLVRAFVGFPRTLKLAIIGGEAGSEDYVGELKTLAKPSPQVVFTGYQFGDSLDQLLANARAYVSASELEGLPLAVLEAMAHGLPCLVSDISPHREVLDQEGQYFAVGDVDGLNRGLLALERLDEDSWGRKSRACRDRVAKNFTWDRAAELLTQRYLASIGAKG